jgi:FkbM family methyltransferase
MTESHGPPVIARSSLLLRLVGRLPQTWIKTIGRAQWKHPLLRTLYIRFAQRFRNQDLEIQKGVGKGLWFNGGRSNAGYVLGTTEPHVQHALGTVLQAGMTMYDVGANVGFLTIIAGRLVGPTGHVIGFEPFPGSARQIELNARLNGFTHVTVCQKALADADGTAQFLVSDEPNWSRLVSDDPILVGQVGEIPVTVCRLDTIVREADLPLPDLIKIDVEGRELDVLAGASDTLRRSRPFLVIELHGTNALVTEALTNLGYYAAVLDGEMSIVEAPWYAHIIAAPVERSDWVRAVDSLHASPSTPS